MLVRTHTVHEQTVDTCTCAFLEGRGNSAVSIWGFSSLIWKMSSPLSNNINTVDFLFLFLDTISEFLIFFFLVFFFFK